MNRKIACVAVGIVMACTSVGATTVSAAKAKAPGRATIVRIISTKQTRSLSKVTITVELPPANGSPIIETVVSGNGRKCVIKKNARSCTVYRVENNIGFPWTAQSRNKVGKGRVSSRVNFLVNNRRWLRTGYTPAGVKYPPSVTRTSGSRILQQGNVRVQKWSKFQPIKQSGIIAASVRAASLPRTNPSLITFQTAGVVGLALPSSGGSGSGLLAVNRDGTVIDAVQSGSASIRDFYVAPNNKFYVVFNSARPLYTGGPNCLLAEVDADSGNPVCVDSALVSVSISLGSVVASSSPVGNSPIQFDSSGGIYYVGQVPTSLPGMTANLITLRKSLNGVVTNLINDYVNIYDYVVLSDDSVLISGMTTSTQTFWVRRISKTGAISTVVSNAQVSFMRKFADGNVYLGMSSGQNSGVRKFDVSTRTLDPKWWIGRPYTSDSSNSYFSQQSVCNSTGNASRYSGFCSSSSAYITGLFNLGSSSTFVIAGMRGSMGTTLMQYYPTVDPVLTSVKNVTLAQMVGRKLILAGSTTDSVNTLVVLDLDTFQETILIDSTNEVEIYNMSYITATNKVMFNGLRFSDNTLVVGEVDMP